MEGLNLDPLEISYILIFETTEAFLIIGRKWNDPDQE
jgi:hypothetical protein